MVINNNNYFSNHILSTGHSSDCIDFVKDLDEEYSWLVHGRLTNTDSDGDFIYHKRMHPDTLDDLWNIRAEEVDAAFPQNEKRLPSADVNVSRLSVNTKIIIPWTMIVLCMWSSFCALSDNALDILLAFLKALFESLEILFPVLASFAVLFPKSLNYFECNWVSMKTNSSSMLCAVNVTVRTCLTIAMILSEEKECQRSVLTYSTPITVNISAEQSGMSHF